MLRILQITPYAAGAWAYGGIPRAAAALTGALVRRGHDVTVATTDVCDARTRLAATTLVDQHRPAVHVFPNRSNWLAYHYQVFTPRGLRHYLHEQVPHFDVVHVHAHRHLLEVGAASACRLHGVPLVLTPNGTAPRIERRRIAKAVWDLAFGDHVLGAATLVTAVTEAERRQLLLLGVAADRLRLLPNSVDLSEFDELPDSTGTRRDDAPPVVLFLGKLTPRKGVDVLMRALGHVDANLLLQIAGNDMGSGRSLRALARELRLESRIQWLGLLCGADRLRALASADLVAYPSRDEVFGLVALESLLCGTPVVVGDDSGCAEIVRLVGGGSQVAPGDHVALADAIRGHLAARHEWRERARAAAHTIRRRFSADSISETAERIYMEAASLRLEATA